MAPCVLVTRVDLQGEERAVPSCQDGDALCGARSPVRLPGQWQEEAAWGPGEDAGSADAGPYRELGGTRRPNPPEAGFRGGIPGGAVTPPSSGRDRSEAGRSTFARMSSE